MCIGFMFASFAPAHLALRAACGRLPSQRPLACVHVCRIQAYRSDQDTGMVLNEPWITALWVVNVGA